MWHYIIVKFSDEININDLIGPITDLFNRALDIDGVNDINIYSNCINKTNRHDLMIKMHLTNEGLENFDNSNLHKEWKEKYGKYIVDKTIFDCKEKALND